MTSKLTRERIELIANFHRAMALPPSHAEIEELARMVLAAMDSKPVAWMHSNNDIGIPAITVSPKIGHYWMAEFENVQPLYRHAQTAPASEPITVTDDMAYAFHHALTDSMIGADDVEEIKTGLRAVFANLTAPVVSAEYPDRLPCSVLLEPGLRFGKGIKTSTMLAALARRAVHESDLAALSPEERAEFQAGIEGFKALIAQPAPVVPNGLRLALSNAGIAAPESDEMLAATCQKHIQALVTWVRDRKPFQSAPVVPEEATPDSIEILASARRRDHAVFQWDEDQRNAAADSWNAFRAAMLQELKKSAGTEAIRRSDENVQVLHTKSPAQSDCCPAQNVVVPAQSPIDHGYLPECECSGCKATARICTEMAVNSLVIPNEMTSEQAYEIGYYYGDPVDVFARGANWMRQHIIDSTLAAAPQSPGSEPATVPGKWIPVSERMPESNGMYFGWDGKRVLEVYCFFGGFSANQFIHGEITHWMPLPAAPQEVR